MREWQNLCLKGSRILTIKLMEIKIKPISVNVCWQGKRFKTKEYAIWRDVVAYSIMRHPKIDNPSKLTVDFYVSSTQSDLDNLLKPLLDAFQESELIKNDNLILEIHAKKIKCKKGEEKIIYEFI